MSPWNKAREWVKRHGFAAGAFTAAAVAIVLALLAPTPVELPGLAQGSDALWRVEHGIISYAAFYLLVLSLALAIGGRGFTEIGPGGVKTGDVASKKRQIGLEKQAEALKGIQQGLAMNATLTQAGIQQLRQEVRELDQRLDELDKRLDH